MQVLDTDKSFLIWGAERPFQIQLLAGMARLGLDVLALSENDEGKKLVDRIHPKNKLGLEIPDFFEGTILWAPTEELFSNSKLGKNSLEDLSKLNFARKKNVQKLMLLLPQSVYGESFGSDFEMYFPTLVGFGDKNVFDKNLDLALRSGVKGSDLEGEFISLFDAASFVLSALKSKAVPKKLWVKGSKINKINFEKGLAEISSMKLLTPISHFVQKISGKLPHFEHEESPFPSTNVVIANEHFPTVLTPWERFFRDSYRIYKSTPDSELLLHFRPSKGPG
jgi:hypothetical protein